MEIDMNAYDPVLEEANGAKPSNWLTRLLPMWRMREGKAAERLASARRWHCG